MYAALPSDPDSELVRLPVDPSYEPIMDSEQDLEDASDDKSDSDMIYPPPFGLYANLLTTCIGLCTFVLLWLPIPILHAFGGEKFHLPPNCTTAGAIAAICVSGAVFNAGLMVNLLVYSRCIIVLISSVRYSLACGDPLLRPLATC